MQRGRGVEGTKDAGHVWYTLLSLILVKDVNMAPATSNKGLFYWKEQEHIVYLVLAKYDILLA